MPEVTETRSEADGHGSGPRKVSPVGLALAGVAALIFVGGTLWSVLSANDETPEASLARPPLTQLVQDAEVVVEGVATSVERLGEPRDAGVLAAIEVEDVIVAPDGDVGPRELTVFDMGFRESWIEGQAMLLFLGSDQDLPEGAELRVLDRCVRDEGGLPCPYEVSEIEELADP